MTERRLAHVVVGAFAGAVTMYLFDPDRGRRRRAILADKLSSSQASVADAATAAVRDARWRLKGLMAEARRGWRREPAPDELRLIERVRAQLGRVVGNPHAIHVGAYRGRITLSGPVLADEARSLIGATRSVQGVREIDDRLVRHAHPGDVPSLQGADVRSRLRTSRRVGLTPAARGAAVVAGSVTLLGLLGAGVLARVALGVTAYALATKGDRVASERRRLVHGTPARRATADAGSVWPARDT